MFFKTSPALCASQQASSACTSQSGFTTTSRESPSVNMARAVEPTFPGNSGSTRTILTLSGKGISAGLGRRRQQFLQLLVPVGESVFELLQDFAGRNQEPQHP